MAALPRWSPKRLPTHQSPWALGGVYSTFPAWHPIRDSPVGSNLESLGPMILMNKPRTVRLSDTRRVSWGAILIEDEASTACVTSSGVYFQHL